MEYLQYMPVSELLKLAAGIIAAASVFIQITPIKWNPISSLLKWIGRKLNEDTNAKIESLKDDMATVNFKVGSLEKRVSEVREDVNIRLDEANARREEDAACMSRTRILSFGGEMIRNIDHTKEEFDNVLDEITKYENYCKEHPLFPNNKTVAITERIKEVYHECISGKRKFLI